MSKQELDVNKKPNLIANNLQSHMSEASASGGYLNKIIPFGAQFFKEPHVDSPGPVEHWSWIPKTKLNLSDEEASSWPGTTGTGPTASEDERYSENQ